jgi:hypothetical protein
MIDYYKKQLSSLDLSQIITIKLTDGDGYQTKYLSLNAESIRALQDLFNEIIKREGK